MKMILVALLFVLAFVLVGCTDAEWASNSAVGHKHRIDFWQNGVIAATWTSTGKVVTGEHGARYAFVDFETKQYTRVGVSNTVVTTLDD